MKSLITALVVVATVLSSGCRAHSASESAVKADDGLDATITLVGPIMYGASTDFDPPGNFAIALGDSSVWLRIEGALAETAAAYANDQTSLEIQGVYEVDGDDVVLKVLNLRPFVANPYAPTEAEAKLARDNIAARTQVSLVANGVTKCGAEYCASMYFESHADLNSFVAERTSQGLSSRVEILQTQTGKKEVQIKKSVIGQVTAQ